MADDDAPLYAQAGVHDEGSDALEAAAEKVRQLDEAQGKAKRALGALNAAIGGNANAAATPKKGSKGGWRRVEQSVQGGTRPAAKQAGIMLHQAIRANEWEEVARLVRESPKAAREPAAVDLRRGGDPARQWGAVLPLHHALLRRAPYDAARALISAHMDAVAARTQLPEFAVPEGHVAIGELPLHLALWAGCEDSVVELLLDANKATAQEPADGLRKVGVGAKDDGPHDVALHVALRSSKCTKRVASALISAYDAALSLRGEDGAYPLHLAVASEAHPGDADAGMPSDAAQVALHVLALRQAIAKEDGGENFPGKPLHVACRVSRTPAVIHKLVDANPSATRERDVRNELPLHVCLRRYRDLDNPHGAAEKLCMELIAVDAGTCREPASDGSCCAVLASCHHDAGGALIDRILAIAPHQANQVRQLRHFEGLEKRLVKKVKKLTGG